MRHSALGRNEPGRPVSRDAIEDLVEQLIALLDALDGDPDLEPDTDEEPWLAGLPGWAGRRAMLDLENDETE